MKSTILDTIRMAFQWPVVSRAMMMSAIVGTLLVGINHGTCLYTGNMGFACVWQATLTFMVPYVVSTVSSVLAMSDLNRTPAG